jgi:hypothetical protein
VVVKKKPEIELEPDAWQRFERFISTVAKAGPQHRAAKATKPKQPKARKARVSPARKPGQKDHKK